MMAARPLLHLEDLRVSFTTAGQRVDAVQGVSLTIAPGEAVAIVGESGSGKSTLSRALLGLLPPGGALDLGGTLTFEGRSLPLKRVDTLRGGSIATVFQDPLNSLNPLMRVGQQIGEAVQRHDAQSDQAARITALLEMVRLPPRAAQSYPHEISGGMRQRVMLAIALACKPKLLIADEPTTALDVTTQKEMLELIKAVRAELGMALLLITHDLGIVTELCTRAHVMVKGRVIESGTVQDVFNRPSHAYSKALLAASRAVSDTAQTRTTVGTRPDEPLRLQIDNVCKTFHLRDGSAYQALRNVTLGVAAGETLALVGESGSGKSTLARVALALTMPDTGDVRFGGESICGVKPGTLRQIRTRMQPVFQDAGAAFNPRRTIFSSIRQAFPPGAVHRRDERERAIALLDQVHLSPGAQFLDRYPHQLSGGQRQRLGIARALAANPTLIVADEPLSGADISTRSRVIDLLTELQETTGVAFLFITHDIFLARSFAHRVAVMHQGSLVELGSAASVTGNPQHPYTQRLVASTLAAH